MINELGFFPVIFQSVLPGEFEMNEGSQIFVTCQSIRWEIKPTL